VSHDSQGKSQRRTPCGTATGDVRTIAIPVPRTGQKTVSPPDPAADPATISASHATASPRRVRTGNVPD
jgi:hypothetical protein